MAESAQSRTPLRIQKNAENTDQNNSEYGHFSSSVSDEIFFENS